MGKHQLKGKDLEAFLKTDKSKSMALAVLKKYYKHYPKEEQIRVIKDLVNKPNNYLKDKKWNKLVLELIPKEEDKNKGVAYELKATQPYSVYGKRFINPSTIDQMDVAMQLPISRKGALMPDAHLGYGLPIGGVLGAENAVIPYGVGIDIGCSMSLTLYDLPANYLNRYGEQLKKALRECTAFGMREIVDIKQEHEVLDNPLFKSTDLLRRLHGKAVKQLGSSGGGNHFVEWGLVELEEDNKLNLPEGSYVGLLAHSGSRGLGATIAQYYTKIALETCYLPKKAQHLAWLDLNTQAGQEYWLAMNLAGAYAKACHDQIHINLAKRMGIKPIAKLENHHNFAWKERQADGQELIVHRKGATPAQEGVLGIIPGSMTAPGYIVSGKAKDESLSSASHGAGRILSRSKAKQSITGSKLRKHLKNEGVHLIDGGVDEAPMVYKNINEVIHCQDELVRIEGKFYPKIVRMAKD